jgi:hypothetical protein
MKKTVTLSKHGEPLIFTKLLDNGINIKNKNNEIDLNLIENQLDMTNLEHLILKWDLRDMYN